MMKKAKKFVEGTMTLSGAGIALHAMNPHSSALSGIGRMQGPIGSALGASMMIDAVKSIEPKKKRRRRKWQEE